MHPSFNGKHAHLTIVPYTSHSSNDIRQTLDAWICWLLSIGAFFVQPFQRACWYGGGWFMVHFETLWHQDATKVCSSWTAVLGFFFASLTIFFTVRGDNMHLHPLPGKFAPDSYFWNFLVIDSQYLSSPLPDLCWSTTISHFSFDSSLTFPMVMDD